MKRKIMKKVIALFASVSLAVPLLTVSAAVPSWSQAGREDFEYESVNEMLENGTIFSNVKNPAMSGIENTVEKSGNKVFRMSSDAKSDNMIFFRKGIISGSKTVIDMKLSSNAVEGGWSRIALRDTQSYATAKNIAGFSSGTVSNAMTLVFKDMLANETVWAATGNTDRYVSLRLVFDRANKSITVIVHDTDKVYKSTTVLDNAWEDDAYITVHSALGNSTAIDDVVLSDGFFENSVYMDENFEHPKTIGAIGNSSQPYYFPLIVASKVINAVYDEETANTYVEIPKGATLYTNNNAGIVSEDSKPTVIEFKLKTDEKSKLVVQFRNSSASKFAFVTMENGIISAPAGKVNVSDGKFHSYRITMIPSGTGMIASLIVDGAWKGNYTTSKYDCAKGRVDIAVDAGSENVCADDIRIYHPTAPKLRLVEADAIYSNSTIKFESNNPINYTSTMAEGLFTLCDDEGCEYSYTWDRNSNYGNGQNTFAIIPDEPLEVGRTYTFAKSSGNNVKDMFEQYYGDTAVSFVAAKTSITAESVITVNGEEYKGAVAEGDVVRAAVNISAKAPGEINAYAYMAQYTSERQLAAVRIVPINQETETTAAGELTATVEKDTAFLKLLIWNDKQGSLCKAVQIDVK